jgi:hypothetical protein
MNSEEISICPSIRPSIYLSICLSVCLSVPTHLPTYLPTYLSIHPSIRLSVPRPCGTWPLFQFLNLYTVGRTPWTVDQPVAKPLPTHRTTQTQNKCTQTCTSRVRLEPTIPMFERAKMAHALDRASTVIGI